MILTAVGVFRHGQLLQSRGLASICFAAAAKLERTLEPFFRSLSVAWRRLLSPRMRRPSLECEVSVRYVSLPEVVNVPEDTAEEDSVM